VRGTSIASALLVGVRRYEDLVAWQLANELKRKVYALVDQSTARDDRRFCDQIRDSAASAPRNLAEGFACYRHPEFARYSRIAKASLTETHNHLGDGVDRRHWPPQDAEPLKELANRAVGACVRLLKYLDSTDAPGTRPRR
jgi:four helix bundle protein